MPAGTQSLSDGGCGDCNGCPTSDGGREFKKHLHLRPLSSVVFIHALWCPRVLEGAIGRSYPGFEHCDSFLSSQSVKLLFEKYSTAERGLKNVF